MPKNVSPVKSKASRIVYYPDLSAPPDLGLLRNILRFIWNRKKGTFLGRTPFHWVLMLTFYFIFWVSLLGFLCLMVYIGMSKFGDKDKPYLHGDTGCLGTSPALAFQPNVRLSSPLVWYGYQPGDEVPTTYSEQVTTFLKTYAKDDEKNEECVGVHDPQANRTKPCQFDVAANLGPCAEPDYGYENRTPCIYFKINKMYNWVPDCYNKPEDLPSKMPEHLKKQIGQMYADGSEHMNSVWISCKGAHPSDTQHMGPIEFFPYPGFPNGYYPYLMQKNFLSPLAAGRFIKVTRDVLVTIRCQAWAHNINPKSSTVEVQFMIADKKEN